MTRLTRCPACTTVFRVTDEQLDLREGFVRCGQCAKVFDARASLADARESTAADRADPERDAADEAAAVDDGAAAPDAPIGTAAALPDADPPLEAGAADTASPAAPAEPAFASVETVAPVSEPLPFGPKHRARSRLATALWGVGSVLLLAAFVAQAAYWFRAELVTAMPESRPYLSAGCRALGCQVPPPRQTALLSIEASELQVDKNVPGLLTLNATLRNRATFAQAHPSIELTLTDADDRPLARRVLAPGEYLGDRLAREPLFAAVSEYSVRLHIDATAAKPTGYRLFLFHP